MNCDFANNDERDDMERLIDPVRNEILPCAVIIPLPLHMTNCGHRGTCVIDRLSFRNTLVNSIYAQQWVYTSQLYYAWKDAIAQDELLFASRYIS